MKKLVLGLLDTSERIGGGAAAEKLRSFTISWSRYGYHDLIIEGRGVNEILDEAAGRGYRFCLIQAYGHVISEHWRPEHLGGKGFEASLEEWTRACDFFVTGHASADADGAHGLDDRCLLVNLERYSALGRPLFDLPVAGGARGRGFVEAGRRGGAAVREFGEDLARHGLWLRSPDAAQNGVFDSHLTSGEPTRGAGADGLMSEDQRRFLDAVALQTGNVRRGVFVWNIEPYDDVAEPPPGFAGPLARLYCVAAGFKPNMILHTHGFDERTTVVYFDYSPDALAVKRLLVEEWDGEDYPRFVRYVFKKFPHPETFYHLWSGRTPDNMDWDEMDGFWLAETKKWGGESVVKGHWRAYRELRHEYVQCNVLTESERLLARVAPGPDSVVWWSNAFFTVYSNWFYTIDERKRLYRRWVEGLAASNPELFLYGADYHNTSVNHVRAREYLDALEASGDSYLNPAKIHRHEIRF